MTPSEREIGEQLGELRSDVRGVGRSVDEMRRVNSEEHAATSKRLGRIEDRIDSLESTRDRVVGAKTFLFGAAGAAFTLLGILIGSH